MPPAAQATALLSGQVVDSEGAIIAGARVVLTQGVGNSTREATSGSDGSFSFSGLPAGAFALTVTLEGFTPGKAEGTLLEGQALELPDITLAIAPIAIHVDAISVEQAGLEQLHIEEQQRLVGVLPNFFVSYNWVAPSLTARQKFTLATRSAFDPGNLALVGTVAGVQQAANAFPGYHQGAAGYGKRYGADLANLMVGTYMGGAVLPSLFRQDPRYFYKGTGSIRSRALYALSRAVICRGDNGHLQPNFAGVLGDLSAGAISNLYYPASDRQGATLTLENGILAIGGDAMNDLVQEFVLNHLTSRGKDKKK